MATGKEHQLIPFIIKIADAEGKQRVVAEYAGSERSQFDKVNIANLQAFVGLQRLGSGTSPLVSNLCEKGDIASLRCNLRPAMLYGYCYENENVVQLVPESAGDLLLPEELPLICAFYHMSSVVRYNPDGLRKLRDSKYWPVLLALRRHGAYRFLMLFWSFMTQCSTYIIGG